MTNRALLVIFFTLFFITFSSLAKQDKFIKHTVLQGETIFQIAQKYKVTPYDIYQLNPDSQNGVKLNSILLIPVPSQKVAVSKNANSVNTLKTHLVQRQETLYTISKTYKVTIEALTAANEDLLKEGLKTGQTIVIPSEDKNKKNGSTSIISKKELQREIVKPVVPQKIIEQKSTENSIYHIIEPKETKYSVSKKYNLTVEELENLNPQIANDFPIGLKLIVATDSKKAIPPTKVINLKKEQVSLVNTIATAQRKQLALLLPFNIAKLESDTINSTHSRLKKDKFLNLTLDFYAGALMAIDSARVLGMNIDIKILDSQETKNSSNVANLVQQDNLATMDAIIGPFYQSNVEQLAELLEPTKTPVISPLSKESGKKHSNLYQSMPTNDILRSKIFDFMRAKDGNIIAVIDTKKGSVRQYVKESQAGTKIAGLSPKGNFSSDSLRIHLRKDKINYVLLASERTGMILSLTSTMLSLQKEYQMQLVIMEPNETLDFEEISLTRLTKLKLLYPSLSRPNETEQANQFDRRFKKINKIIPSEYAIRGFDITFDTLLRLSQEKTFEETIQTAATDQFENKFDYVRNSTSGYSNQGIYILYYDTDLTIKEAF